MAVVVVVVVFLVTVVVWLVRSVLGHAQVISLHFIQLGQLDIQMVKMRSSNLFVEL